MTFATSGDRGLAEQGAHLGEEVGVRLDAVLHAQPEHQRPLGGDAVDEHRALARVPAQEDRELADDPGLRLRRVDPQPDLALGL